MLTAKILSLNFVFLTKIQVLEKKKRSVKTVLVENIVCVLWAQRVGATVDTYTFLCGNAILYALVTQIAISVIRIEKRVDVEKLVSS